ncbi:MAG: proprotein convertase P-domain-containing protein [Bacteroidota bacterium]
MKGTFILIGLVWANILYAQITFNGVGGLLIPPNAPNETTGITESTCSVTGIGVLGGCYAIEKVTINLLHSWDNDLGIFLVAPNGQVLELSSENGDSKENYLGTVFRDDASIFITEGFPPFSGNFKPEGRINNLVPPYSNGPALGTFTFANTFNGSNADGDWTLYISDNYSDDVGRLINWSITFNKGSAAPIVYASPDQNICTGQSTLITAIGNGNYLWSTGATTPSIIVSPTSPTTYTVTTTVPACGTASDEVVVTPYPVSASITPSSPYICPGKTVTLNANPGYTGYTWSNGKHGTNITVISAGTYTVTVTNTIGCTAVASFNLPGHPNPTISLYATDVNMCIGDCKTLQASLIGTPPFQFTWQFQVEGSAVGNSQAITVSGSSINFQVCPPPGGTGLFDVVICTLSDAFCTN